MPNSPAGATRASHTTPGATRRLNFTKTAIGNLAAPPAGRHYTYDLKVPGLALAVTATGAKSFYVYRRVHGRPQRIRLGGFPELTVEQARKKAHRVNADIADGYDPQYQKNKARTELTLGEVFDWFIEHYAKPRKKTWQDDEDQFDCYFDRWRSRRLSSITWGDVQAWHTKVGTKAPYSRQPCPCPPVHALQPGQQSRLHGL